MRDIEKKNTGITRQAARIQLRLYRGRMLDIGPSRTARIVEVELTV
jgi:hypothetical protein